jgi:hypothetical protein
MRQEKVVSRKTAVGVGFLCVVLLIGLIGVTIEYESMLNDKDSQISDLNSRIWNLQAEIDSLNLTVFVERSTEFLLNQFNESLGLCGEAPQAAPNTYWLVSDNLWAWKALDLVSKSGFPDAYRAGVVANEIYSTLTTLAKNYSLPADSNGLPISYEHEAVIGDVAMPPYKGATVLTVYDDGYPVNTIVCNGTLMPDWDNYADLVLYCAISYNWEHDQPDAVDNFSTAVAMWNATSMGLQDKAFNGTYDTYKLALLLYASRLLGQGLPFESELLNRIYSQQNASDGGIVTNYYADGTPVGDANTETTSMVIIALLTPPAAFMNTPDSQLGW